MFVSGVRSSQQDKLLEELAATSDSEIAVSFVDGRLAALEGMFPGAGGDLADLPERTRSFLERWIDLFQLPVEVLGASNIVDSGLDGRREVVLPVESGGIPWFDSGIRAAFDKKGRLRSIRVQLKASLKAKSPTSEELERARHALEKWRVSEDAKPPPLEPKPVVVSSDWLGRKGRPRVVFEFAMPGEGGQATVLVDIDGDGETFIPIGVRPEGIPAQTPMPAYHLNPQTNCPDFIHFGHPGCLLPEAVNGDARRVALAFFRRYPECFGTGDPDRQLVIEEVLNDRTGLGLGTTVVLAQHFAGVPVYGCQLRVHLSSALAIISIGGAYFSDPGVSVIPSLNPRQCFEAAYSAWARGGRILPQAPLPDARSARLVIVPTRLTRSGGADNHLTWHFEFFDESIFVSAETGKVVLRLSRIFHAVDVFDSNQRRATYLTNSGEEKFADEYRGATLQLIDGVLQVPEPDLDKEARRLAAAIDEVNGFWRRCGRNGWNSAGGKILGYVDASFAGPNIAYSESGGFTVFSTGSVNEELVGHELTHHLITGSSQLMYVDESGAANESYADVFGALLAFAPPGSIGNLLAGSPRTYAGYLNLGPADNGGVHTNSSILNRAGALLCNGQLGTGHVGIGRSRMTRLYFETLTKKLTPWSQFIDVLHLTLSVAEELIAASTPGVDFPPTVLGGNNKFNGSEIDEVLWAFDQVGLSPRWTRGWFKVQGRGTMTQTFYSAPLPGGETVSNVTVIARRQDNQRTNNRVSATGPTTDTNPANGITLAMSVPPVLGTPNALTVATVTSPNFIELYLAATIDRIVPPPTGSPPIPSVRLETPIICHFPTVGGGNRFTDEVYLDVPPLDGCVVEDVELELWRRHSTIPGALVPLPTTHRLGEPGISGIDFGAYITANRVGTSDLLVSVNCWHGAFVACRYLLKYYLRGNGCALPTLTFKKTIRS